MTRSLGALLLLVAWAAGASATVPSTRGAPSKADTERAKKVVAAAVESATSEKGQARALVHLVWPDQGKRDETVAQIARTELVGFGSHGMFALYEAINSVRKEYTADVVRAIVEAGAYAAAGNAPEYTPALVDTLWTGSREAKLLALPYIVAERPALAVQPMIDSAIDDPALCEPVVAALGKMHYESARFWLEKIMITGAPELRPAAASSLAQIGGAALVPLRNAMKADDKATRILAVRAILPAATDYDLGAIYAYLEKHADDDPALARALKATATNIEKAIAARDASEAASAPKDF